MAATDLASGHYRFQDARRSAHRIAWPLALEGLCLIYRKI